MIVGLASKFDFFQWLICLCLHVDVFYFLLTRELCFSLWFDQIRTGSLKKGDLVEHQLWQILILIVSNSGAILDNSFYFSQKADFFRHPVSFGMLWSWENFALLLVHCTMCRFSEMWLLILVSWCDLDPVAVGVRENVSRPRPAGKEWRAKQIREKFLSEYMSRPSKRIWRPVWGKKLELKSFRRRVHSQWLI